MPIISLDEISSLIAKHPRYEFLSRHPLDVLPITVSKLLDTVKASSLWQLLSFSRREIMDQFRLFEVPEPEAERVTSILSDSLIPHGFALRESVPFAIRVERKPQVFVKYLTDTAKSFTSDYGEATYYWNRWQGFQALTRLAKGLDEKTRLVFRSESLKLGYDIART